MAHSTIDSLIDAMSGVPVEIPHGEAGAQLKLVGGRPSRNDVESEVGRLNLVVEALVRLVVRKGLAKPAELAELLAQIDREDGVEDGQLKTHRSDVPEWCDECEARIAPGWTSCAFCGVNYGEEVVHIAELKGAGQSTLPPTYPEWCPDCDARVLSGHAACRFCGAKLQPISE
jgi:hypothetical protein